jgi:hypothetical protein
LNLRALSANRVCRRTCELYQCFAIKELKWLSSSELECVAGKAARGHQNAPIRTFGRNDPEELSDQLDGNLPIQPVLALDDHAFAAADELEVDAAVGLTSATLPHEIALTSERLADQELKIGPAHLPQRLHADSPG